MSRLERTTHIFLIALCAVSILFLLERGVRPAPQVRAGRSEWESKVLDLPGADWTKSRMNVVLYVSSSCHFCRESSSFYRLLAEERRKLSSPVAFTVLSKKSDGGVREWLTEQRIEVDNAYDVPTKFRLRGTPTLLLVDSTGVVKKSGCEQEFARHVGFVGV
jgi:thioredoxin-related protein